MMIEDGVKDFSYFGQHGVEDYGDICDGNHDDLSRINVVIMTIVH